MPLSGDHVCKWQSLWVYCHSNYYRGLKPVVILFFRLLSAGCEILHTAEKPRYCMHTLMPSQLMCMYTVYSCRNQAEERPEFSLCCTKAMNNLSSACYLKPVCIVALLFSAYPSTLSISISQVSLNYDQGLER